MVNALKGFLVGILVFLTFGVFPAYQNAKDSEAIAARTAEATVNEFVDTVRGQGYVSVQDYETLKAKLDSTQNVYVITIEYYKKVLEPVYSDPNDFSTFQNTFQVRYDGYYTKQVLEVLYPNKVAAADDLQRRFNMHVGDIFNLQIERKNISLSSQIGAIFMSGIDMSIPYERGGMVRSEAP